MLRLWILCLVFATLTFAELDKRFLLTNEVCYGDLGCFNTKSPFWSLQRPVTLLPDTPEKINTRFFLYTSDNDEIFYDLKHTDVAAGKLGPFKPNLPTKLIVHGFLESANYPWVRDMKDAFLRKASMNVIGVDWRGGNKMPYTQATANTQVVGAEIARLLKALNQFAGMSLSNVHVIGHSLGAHVAGYAGERVNIIGRITGLDPAEPYFQNTDPIVRLDPTDAALVDVIHTDGSSMFALGMGMIQTVGHLDFFPNGGFDQPGCRKNIGKITGGLLAILSLDYEQILYALGCSHIRSYQFFTESIEATTCNFRAYPCAKYDDFVEGKCLTCAGGSCPQMGLDADQFRGAHGSYFLQTSDNGPFCSYHHSVALSTGQTVTGKGTITLKIVGASGTIDDVEFNSDDVKFKPSSTYSTVVKSSKNIGAIQSVVVTFQKTGSWITGWLYPDVVEIDFVNVRLGESQQQVRLCTGTVVVQSGMSATYTVC